jgi:hypothetical protein
MPDVSADRILRLGYAYREARALLSAVELGVFSALAEKSLDLEALTERIRIDRRGARDFFDALVALGLLERDAAGHYACTAESALYLDRRKATYLGDDLEFNAQLFGRWNLLTRALKSGKPQNAVAVKGNFPALYADPAALEAFARGMSTAALSAGAAIAEKFPWPRYRTVADIGSARGVLLAEVASAHSHLSGSGFDLPPMKPLFDSYVMERGLSGRLEFHPGDFFHAPLPGADVLVLGRVLHDWNLETKMMLLGKAYAALPAGGALIVYERLIDDERRSNAAGLLASLNMLLMTEGGFDFTGADCAAWMRETGFRDLSVEPLTGDQAMVVGFK